MSKAELPSLTAAFWYNTAFAMANELRAVWVDRHIRKGSFSPTLLSDIKGFFDRVVPFLVGGVPKDPSIDIKCYRLAASIIYATMSEEEFLRNLDVKAMLGQFHDFISGLDGPTRRITPEERELVARMIIFFDRLVRMGEDEICERSMGRIDLDTRELAIAG